jgi:hypothetical protein
MLGNTGAVSIVAVAVVLVGALAVEDCLYTGVLQ